MRTPLTFFALVLALSLPFWLLGSLVDVRQWLPIDLPLSSLQAVCPVLAAVILLRRQEGPQAVKMLLRTSLGARSIRPVWWVVVLVTGPAILAITYVAQVALGRSMTELSVDLVPAAILALVFLISGYTEQVGWMGYATPPLQERWGALGAALAIGLFWALWHVFPWYVQLDNTIMWTTGQFSAAVAWRVLFAWVYNNTGASVLATVVMQAAFNVATFLYP